MNILSQEARKRQAVVKLANRKGVTFAAEKYGVSRSSVKRLKKRYDGTWKSLVERSHRPNSHPWRHTESEEMIISKAFWKKYRRYGWYGVYEEAKANGYTRSLSGLIYAAKRLDLVEQGKEQETRHHNRRYPELLIPGEKVQIDVKEVPYNCLRGNLVRDNKHLYQWTAIDECTRIRFVYGFEEHTPENSVKFLRLLVKVFPFKIRTIQTDNGTEFTYKYISDTEECPFDQELRRLGIQHKLIPPRTPWHNGKVERSHRNDQRYFYDWETFRSLEDFNKKLAEHLIWSNNKPMRTLKDKSPRELLAEKLAKK